MERRSQTGHSSATADYGIPAAAEHRSQYGDMKIISSEPVWDTMDSANMYETWLNGRKDNPTNCRQFAKQHTGITGRKNISLIDLRDFYIGKDHLGIRASESISLGIGYVAKGEY